MGLERAGSGPALVEEIAKLEAEGLARKQKITEEAWAFYLANIGRRSWSPETKQRLEKEYFESIPDSVLSVSRLQNSSKIVGTLQNIRSPYGRRILARQKGARLEVMSDEFGVFGESVRKFGIKIAEVQYLSNAELYDRMNANRNSDGLLKMIRPPAERKMIEQAFHVIREGIYTGDETVVVDGEELLVIWYAGEVDEPARLAVDRSQNPHLFVEVLTQLLTCAIDPHFSMEYNLHGRLHVTYNDRPALYLAGNFRPTGRSLIIDGKPWPVLFATDADHIESLRNASRPLEEGDAKRLAEIKHAVEEYIDHAH
jgi:hypothetical protein